MASTYIALLRGINVGGKNPLRMADLRATLEKAGARDVVTYIQSGNVVFKHAAAEPALARKLARVIDAPVVLRTAKQLSALVASNPYPDDTAHLHVMFFAEETAVAVKAELPERYELIGRELYLCLPGGLGRSKLAARVGKLPGTVRNWRTVQALLALTATG